MRKEGTGRAFRDRLTDYNVVAAAVAVFLVTGAAYVFWPSNWHGSDLTSNLFAGSFDTIFTVGLLAFFIRQNERRRSRPARFAAYIEMGDLLSEYCMTWFEMIRASSEQKPDDNADLFSEDFVKLLSEHLNLDADRGTTPPMAWRHRLYVVSENLLVRTDRVIQRYQTLLNPDLIMTLLDFERMSSLRLWKHVSTSPQADEVGLPFVKIRKKAALMSVASLKRRLSSFVSFKRNLASLHRNSRI